MKINLPECLIYLSSSQTDAHLTVIPGQSCLDSIIDALSGNTSTPLPLREYKHTRQTHTKQMTKTDITIETKPHSYTHTTYVPPDTPDALA